MKEIPYIKLHVTLIAGRLNPEYFGRNSSDEVPQAILTTNSGKTDFLSLVARVKFENGETLYKIFSHHSMSNELLDYNFFYVNSYETLISVRNLIIIIVFIFFINSYLSLSFTFFISFFISF